MIFALLLGGQLYGFIGAFVALPVAAVIRETVVYLRRHLVLEPWGTPSAAELGRRAKPPPAARCPECGAARPEERRLLPGLRHRARLAPTRRPPPRRPLRPSDPG